MLCFDHDPQGWQELQNLTARLFSEIGCTATVGKRIKLVRGDKEIDVAVEDAHIAPPSRCLCECKYWNKAIPQEVIHSFRTVVADYGAHRGFIISIAGFQAGAHKAVENTNISLVTFAQLQEIFFDRWRRAMGKRYMPFGDRLFPYWDPVGGKRPPKMWGRPQIEKLVLLTEAYKPFIDLGPTLEWSDFHWNLPLEFPSVDANGDVNGEVSLKTYRQVYDFIETNKDNALKHFQILFGERS